MDPTKVAVVDTWPRPRSLRALRGFLGLTGYYHKFIAGYGAVAWPLYSPLEGGISLVQRSGRGLCVVETGIDDCPIASDARFFKTVHSRL